MTKAFTKTIATALTIATISGAFVSTASASDRGFHVKPVKQQHSRKANIAGALLGIGGALIGAALVSGEARASETRYGGFRDDEPRPYGHGRPRAVAFIDSDEACFEKPIKRFDRYSGDMIIVGYKTICR